MHRSSESIAALAAALAKAQSELSNPEKSLVATIGPDRPGEGARTFRYAPLSSGLDIVRKTLGQQQIATVQTTSIDNTAGTVNLTTVLAHESGEWIASDWPVCRLADTASPHRRSTDLVGIAGEDDLDAPDLNGRSQAGGPESVELVETDGPPGKRRWPPREGNGSRRTVLGADASAAMREQLMREVASLATAAEAAQWARSALSAKNRLAASDARVLELAFELRLSVLEEGPRGSLAAVVSGLRSRNGAAAARDRAKGPGIDKSALTIAEPRRYRDKAHLEFVASQPCLICGRKPSDPHHLRFAQRRALGRRVSDEFTVPLCRLHHREAHRIPPQSQGADAWCIHKIGHSSWRGCRGIRAATR